MEQSHVAGLSVTCMKGNPCGVTETYSWGEADLETKEKVTPLTRFQMASMTKVVATAFVIQFFNERNREGLPSRHAKKKLFKNFDPNDASNASYNIRSI